jgi:hypothetical protein
MASLELIQINDARVLPFHCDVYATIDAMLPNGCQPSPNRAPLLCLAVW